MHRPRTGGGRALGALAFGLLLALPTCCGSAAVAASAPRTPRGFPSKPYPYPVHTLRVRNDSESVVLADCLDGSGNLSSEMAYFPGAPGSKPQDVAVVATGANQSAIWTGATTSALFTDTGVVFTAVIGPEVSNRQYAGTGDNGYATFTCWQDYSTQLYRYDGTVCSQVYLCNHQAAPSPTPTPTGSSSNSTDSTSGSDQGLSAGAAAGIGVGVAAAVIIAVAAGICFWIRRKRRSQSPTVDRTQSRRSSGRFGRFGKIRSPVSSPTSPVAHVPNESLKNEVGVPYDTHELAAQGPGHQGRDDPGLKELDGMPRSEIDGRERPQIWT